MAVEHKRRHHETEVLLKRGLDHVLTVGRRFSRRSAKQHVAAGDICAHVVETEADENLPETVHLHISAAHIDRPQKGHKSHRLNNSHRTAAYAT